MKPEAVGGSALWQTIFVSFAVVVVLLEIARGWSLGLPRQLVRLGAIITAYAAAFFGGKLLPALVRPLLDLPDLVIRTAGGAVLALIVYVSLTTAGAMMFKRTREQPSAPVRLIWGLSGAALGFLFGAFAMWLFVVGIRTVGAVAHARDATADNQAAARGRAAPRAPNVAGAPEHPNAGNDSFLHSIAQLKDSIERGSIGDAIKRTDVLPASTYTSLEKVGRVVADQRSAERFLSYAGAKELSEHPRIVALRDDPEIVELVQQGRFLDLLQNRRVIDALNDPTLTERLQHFDLQKALDYALGTDRPEVER